MVKDIDDLADDRALGIQSAGEEYHAEFLLKRPRAEWAPYIDETAKDISSGIQISDLTLSKNNFGREVGGYYRRGLEQTAGRHADLPSVLEERVSDEKLGRLAYQLNEFSHEISKTHLDIEDIETATEAVIEKVLTRQVGAQLAVSFDLSGVRIADVTTQLFKNRAVASNVDLLLSEFRDSLGGGLFSLMDQPQMMTPLWAHQREALRAWADAGFAGYVDMATATGKTVLGLAAIALCYGQLHPEDQFAEGVEAVPAASTGSMDDVLIVAHSDLILEQWRREFETHLNIPQERTTGDDSIELEWGRIHFRTAQSLINQQRVSYDLVLLDEAHHYATGPEWGSLLEDFDCNILAMSGSVDDAGAESGRIKKRLTNGVGPELSRYTITDARADGVIPAFDWEVNYAPYDVEEGDLKRGAERAEDAFENFQDRLAAGEIDLETDRRLETYQDVRSFSHTTEGKDLKSEDDSFRTLVTRLFSRRTKQWNLSPIIESVIDLVIDHYAKEKVVVLADSNAQVEQIESRLTDVFSDTDGIYRISESQDLERQREVIEAFDAPGTTGVLIGTGGLLGEGVDMQRASVAINMATGGVNKALVQRIGRVLRNPVDTPKHATFYNVVGVPPTLEGAVSREDGKQLIEQAAGFCMLGRQFDKLPHFSIAESLDSQLVAALLDKGSEFMRAIDTDGQTGMDAESIDRADLSALLTSVSESSGSEATLRAWNEHATAHSMTQDEILDSSDSEPVSRDGPKHEPEAAPAETDGASEAPVQGEGEGAVGSSEADTARADPSDTSPAEPTSEAGLSVVRPDDGPDDEGPSRLALLSEIQQAEDEVGDVPTKADMQRVGQFDIPAFEAEFGTWSDAVREAGFVPHGSSKTPSHSREDVVEALERIGANLSRPPKTSDINEHAEFSTGAMYRHFDSIVDARRAAGVNEHRDPTDPTYTRQEVLGELQRIGEKIGEPPTTDDIDEHAEFSASSVYTHFDSIPEARAAAGVEEFPPAADTGAGGMDESPEIQPSPLSELYESLYRLYSFVRAVEPEKIGSAGPEDQDVMERWETALEEVLFGAGVTDETPNYGSQQSERCPHSIKAYREQYGDGKTVREYQCVVTQPIGAPARKILSEQMVLSEDESVQLPTPPDGESHLPLFVRTEGELREAIDLLQQFPAEPSVFAAEEPQHKQGAEAATADVDEAFDRDLEAVPEPGELSDQDQQFTDTVDAQENDAVFWDRTAGPVTQLKQSSATQTGPAAGDGDSVDSKIDEWKSQLLDLTRRNNLISFNPTKSKSLSFDRWEPSHVAEQLDDGAELQVHRRVVEDGADSEGQLRTKSDTVAASELVPTREEREAEHSLNQISIKNKRHLRERGVTSLYLALGMLRWYDVDHADEANRSPLLLAPIELQGKPVRDADLLDYTITRRSAEVILNPALRKKLAAERGLDLPADEAISLRNTDGVFESIHQITAGFEGWSIQPSVVAGIFDFTKLSLYSDLERNRDKILADPIIRALNGDMDSLQRREGGIQTPKASELDDVVDPVDTFQVLDADSSQQEAIEAAKRGKSFVLQGPPGTGKSQTIANIITEKIALGERVLFVSEKQAALDVVKQRLTEAGVGRFCLEVHGEKATHKSVLQHLSRELQSDPVDAVADRTRTLKRLRDRRSAINQHGDLLFHSPDGWETTVYEALGIVSRYDETPWVATGIDKPLELSQDTVETAIEELETLARFEEQIQTAKSSPWRHTTLREWGIETDELMRRSLTGQTQAIQTLGDTADQVAAGLGFRPDSLAACREAADMLEHLSDRPAISWQEGFFAESFVETGQQLEELAKVSRKRDSLVTKLLKNYDESILSVDGIGLSDELDQYGVFKTVRPAYRAARGRLTEHAKPTYSPGHEQVFYDAQKLAAIQRLDTQLEIYQDTAEALGQSYNGRDTDWEMLISARRWLGALVEFDNATLSGAPDLLRKAQNMDCAALAKKMNGALQEYDQAAEFFESAMDTGQIGIKGARFVEAPLSDLSAALAYLLDRTPDLQGRVQFAAQLDRVQSTVCGTYCNQALEDGVDPEQLVAGFKRRFYSQWLNSVYEETSVGSFRVDKIRRDLEQFQQLDVTQQELAQTEVQHRVTERRPELGINSSATVSRAVLQREIKKERNYKPLRELFDEAASLISRLTPCFMMSPLSVAEHLKSESIAFDTVVFDEASQVMPQDAVSSLIRADQAILAGDSKQLPPTSFFEADVETTEDVREDLDSILEETASVLPEKSLRWHYRSRSEELIQFSNHHYYDNKLRTFPENEPEIDTGVEFEYVEDGTYDRGASRQNVIEAERVVDLVEEHAETHGSRSLGVVAFSSAQEQAIRDALADRCAESVQLDSFVDQDDALEEFFIKNLEMVQGDERDRMIFSVGYGPAADGTISTNFGPLNKAGGERRLNVAVTRAKEKVTVVCSMQPGDVDLSGSNSVGAQHFKDYLKYANVGERALTRQDRVEPTLDFDSQFEKAVYDALESAGYDPVTQVKSSSYSIDLAIKHPEQPGSYVLGIECDGAAYHASKTARDRDRTRQLVLENLGWDIHRIWSPDWASNEARQLELIDERVDSLLDSDLSAAKSGDAVTEESRPTPEPRGPHREAVIDYVQPTLYSETRYSPGEVGAEQANMNAVKDTILENGPIDYEAALQVYLSVWRESQITDNIRRAFDLGLSALRRDGVVVQNGDVLWPSAESLEFDVRVNTDSASRKIQNVPVEELAKASTIVLSESGPMSESELRSQTASLLGYESVTSWMEEHLAEGVALLKRRGVVNKPSENEFSLDPDVDVDTALTGEVY